MQTARENGENGSSTHATQHEGHGEDNISERNDMTDDQKIAVYLLAGKTADFIYTKLQIRKSRVTTIRRSLNIRDRRYKCPILPAPIQMVRQLIESIAYL